MASIVPREIGSWFRRAHATAILRPLTGGLAGALLLSAVACGGKVSPVAPTPTPTPTPTATTFTLSGTVTSTTGTAINGATVRINDGANAGRSTTTAGGGVFNLTGLSVSGFTLNVTATNYVATGSPVTLTSNQNVRVQLAPTPLFSRSGVGDAVFDLPTSAARLRIEAAPSTSCQNFAVQIAGRLVVNVLLGTSSVADSRTHDGTYWTSGGVAQVTLSSGVRGTFSEVR